MKYLIKILLIFLAILPFFESKPLFGIIEGFYWTQSDSIDGIYGEFTHLERRNLLKLEKKLGLSTYIYGPKQLLGSNYERAYNVSLLGDLYQWKETFELSKSLNITFLWSLSPGWLPPNNDDFSVAFQKMLKVVQTLKLIGCSGFVLSLDDTPGGATDEQYGWQGELINQLESHLGVGLFHAYVPGFYYGSSSDLSQKLSILDSKIKKEIPFVWSGVEVWNINIKKTDIPILPSGRKFILWDNWIATDSSEINKLVVDPPEIREKILIDNLKEFWLNLAFPSYRMVPAIASFSQVMKNGVANYTYYWSDENRKVYSDINKINSVLLYDGQIWCNYFQSNCSQIQINSYFELIKGLNYMEFDRNKIDKGALDAKIVDLYNAVINR